MWKHFGLILVAALIAAVMFSVPVLSEASFQNEPLDSKLMPVKFATQPNTLDPNQIFAMVNQTRQRADLPPLRANKVLAQLASQRARDMAERQYYAHKTPDGQYYFDILHSRGMDPDHSCENLDMVIVPKEHNIIQDWLASTKGHRECMLDNNLIEAGYAAVNLPPIDYNGTSVTPYLVVAIHSTQLTE